jgi:NAD(P)H-quinone oxidoreductase subunit L
VRGDYFLASWFNPNCQEAPKVPSDKGKIMIVPLLYVSLAGTYLLVMPVFVIFYLKFRWYTATSFERAFMYFLVFFFFPGMLVLSPILNFRPRRRQIEA